MRILLLIGELNTGGAERQLQILAKAFAGNGHEVVIVTLFPSAHGDCDLCESIHLLSLSARRGRFRALRGGQLVAAPWRLRKLVRAVRPDFVYSMLHLANLFAWIATRNRCSARLIWGYRASNMRLNFGRRIPERLCSWVSSSVPLMIANSDAGARFAADVRRFRPRRLAVVPNGIDTAFFRPFPAEGKRLREALGISEAEFVVGSVARIDPMKGHDVLLRAAAYVLQRRDNYRFLIVGEGPPQRLGALKVLASCLGVADRVLWIGNRADMPTIYSAMDVFCSSSSYGEGYPNVIAEAMACATHCVVTDVGDSAAIVGPLGRVVPPGDPVALGRELLTVADWNATIPRGELRRRIKERFAITTLYQTTARLLEELRSEC